MRPLHMRPGFIRLVRALRALRAQGLTHAETAVEMWGAGTTRNTYHILRSAAARKVR